MGTRGKTTRQTVSIPSMWICGFTHAEMARTGCTYREALVAAVEVWQEQERLEAQYRAGN